MHNVGWTEIDRAIGEVAGRQHGVLSRRQLADLGLGRGAIQHRLDRGRLLPLLRGVYAVGHLALTRESRWMAAALAGGARAALSHGSAAALWGLRPAGSRRADVTVPTWRRSRPQIRFHAAPLPADEVTLENGIPVTAVPRTILDLAAILDRRAVERCVNEAEIRRLWDSLSLVDLLDRHGGRPGAPAIRAILRHRGEGAAFTRSELELRFLQFVAAAGLPAPAVNQPLWVRDQLFEVDCLWRTERVVVELDGRAYHLTALAFEEDRRRHRILEAAGWRTVQVTWRQLHRETAELETDLRRLLSPA